MQNEFEKQVQLKMEELKLVPSEPVWQKVEMQIRKEKDRRRVLLWIPLLTLIGAGLWLGINKYAQTTAFKSPAPVKENQVASPAIVTHEPTESFKTVPVTTGGGRQAILNNKIQSRRFTPFDVKRSSPHGFEDKGAIAKEMKIPVPENKKLTVTESKETTYNSDLSKHIVSPSTTQPKATPTFNDSIGKTQPEINTASQPVKQDSTSVKAVPVKKYAISRKWTYNLVVASGSSGLGRVEFANGQKSMNVYSSPPSGASSGGTGQFSSYGPSSVENGFAFSAGGTAKKQLTKRTAFTTGLHYNYYSNTIQVGSQVNQNRTILNFPVSRFYSAQATGLQPYKNQYHFLSVPADMDWQILNKHPLNLSFGISFQYLVTTNALRYDYTTQSYFHNINAFNRAQLMSGTSLTYSVPVKHKPLSFGPQVQYGLTRLEKGNANNHLFSYGLKAQWQFKN